MPLKIEIKKESLGNDPPVDTYHVTLDNGSGIWKERYTRSELEVFLRGVEATAAMISHELIPIPEIPR